MPTYSFLDTNATIIGPGGIVNLAAGASVAEEGITIEPIGEKNVMTIGADGGGQHSLIASDAKRVTVRLLKTSPVNAQLMLMYNLQSVNSRLWGQNIFTLGNTGSGDQTVAQACAFNKVPTLTYAQEAGTNEWVWDSIKGNTILGGNA